jgi:hypothetical protein
MVVSWQNLSAVHCISFYANFLLCLDHTSIDFIYDESANGWCQITSWSMVQMKLATSFLYLLFKAH